jgi:ABC-type protease/lipase transport system fused ATPase/permease subunit
VEQSISAWRTFVVARASYGRLQDLLQATPEQATGIVLPPPEGRIEVENLTFKPITVQKPLLQHISFALAPGESLGIVGPSAAGKSTLCRMLVGVYPPTLGSVRLDAAEVHAWNREEFGRYAKLADVHEMVLRLPDGYDTQIGEGGALLSAGQRQRIGLARALPASANASASPARCSGSRGWWFWTNPMPISTALARRLCCGRSIRSKKTVRPLFSSRTMRACCKTSTSCW